MSMRIADIQCHLMQAGGPPQTGWTATGKSALASSRNWLFVTVHTDCGMVGTGEGSGWPRAVAAAVQDLGGFLVGESLHSIERLHQRMRTAVMSHGQVGTVGSGAIAAIDMALWDLRAQALGVPISQLLGGPLRQAVPYYTHASSVAAAEAAVRRGVRAIKVGGIKGVVERAYAIRAALGPEIDMMVDLHGPPWLNAADAIAIGRELEPLGLLFLEEPVAPDDLPGWRRVRSKLALPLATGERLATLSDMLPFITEGLVDVVQPDTGRFGGLTQMHKLAAIAEAHSLQLAPHSGSLGPVAEFAAVHLLSAIPNGLVLERMDPDWAERDAVITQTLNIERGHIDVPAGPGLGTALQLDAIARHPSQRNIAIADGGYNAGTESESLLLQARRPRAALTRK
ncbi:mandelate racemase/muconate lactonizing enzyme family protein [Roseateles violae]|uniref:Mandelate racemase/muconate lactonizing enzyme family protein n=1 Tax=Roseateles violae TaxID=3058042 RepID=A0ABT8DT22_9BURK|nr:mandelate racemase/muconate lactonizing enzyme family protein [Pelomonas sp. PFR6]MDN3921462.1 mandelate racemase/muconate lactonizing enzyme family protein [Pelomonas sp. PFR6]